MSFKGHKDHGQYAGDYIFAIKQAVQAGRAATGGPSGNFDQLTKYNSNEKMKNAWDKGDISLEMGLVPDKYKAQAKEYILSRSAELGKLSIEIQKMREAGNTQEPLYNELRMQADGIDQELGPNGTFTANWKKFNEMAQEHSENGLSGAYSEVSNDSEDELAYSNIFSNSEDLQIGEGASLNFGNNEMGFSNFQDLKPLNLTAYKDGNKLLNQMDTVFDKGEVLDPNKELFYSNTFNELIKEGGSNTLLSLAFDPIYGPGVDAQGGRGGILRRNQWEQQIADIKSGDPTLAARATDEVIKATHDAYMQMLKDQAQAGYDKKNPAATGDGWSFDNPNFKNGKFDSTAFQANYPNVTVPINPGVELTEPEGYKDMNKNDQKKIDYDKNKQAHSDYQVALSTSFKPMLDDLKKTLRLKAGNKYTNLKISGVTKGGEPLFQFDDRIGQETLRNYTLADIEKYLNTIK